MNSAEFDKRTKLGATKTFPKLIQSDSIMSESMAKAVCFQVSQDILNLVPQVDDYLCPICFSIAWRPIRLRCKHIFCIRCTVRMQKDKKLYCPLCRDKVIMEADQGISCPCPFLNFAYALVQTTSTMAWRAFSRNTFRRRQDKNRSNWRPLQALSSLAYTISTLRKANAASCNVKSVLKPPTGCCRRNCSATIR